MKRSTYLYEHPLFYEIGFCLDRVDSQVSFMLQCLREHGRAHGRPSILDNGCGTGRYLEKFADRGFRVSGYDLCPQMVEYASARLAKTADNAHVFVADLRDFETPRRHDLAICTEGSFQYLYTVCDVLSHFECVARSLRKGGLYIVPLPAPEELIASPPGTVVSRWSRARGGISVTIDFTYRQHPIDWSTQTFSGLAKVAVSDHGTRLDLSMPYKYRLFFPQELEALVAASRSLQIVDFYGDYHRTKRYSSMRRPKHLIAVLRKKG